MSMSYSPYSHVKVGAAGYTTDGRVVDGANVENASYGLTLCAECSLVSDLARQGGGRLAAVCVVAGDELPIAPCGRCRQLLYEHGGGGLLVDAGPEKPPRHLHELLPDAFGPDDLGSRASS
jgi:cytidine deaminase